MSEAYFLLGEDPKLQCVHFGSRSTSLSLNAGTGFEVPSKFFSILRKQWEKPEKVYLLRPSSYGEESPSPHASFIIFMFGPRAYLPNPYANPRPPPPQPWETNDGDWSREPIRYPDTLIRSMFLRRPQTLAFFRGILPRPTSTSKGGASRLTSR